MPIKILMPALSPTMTEGNLAKWHKKEGDKIKPGQVIAEIETDKATMEVESADEGILAKIIITENSKNVKVNSIIAILLEEGEDKSALENMNLSQEQAPPEKIAEKAKEAPTTPTNINTPPSSTAERVFITPLAKRIASECNIDVSKLTGSGPHGRIVKADVMSSSFSSSPTKFELKRVTPEVSELPISNIREVIAKRLCESKQQVPHFYLSIDCNIERLLQMREEINSATDQKSPEWKISVNDFAIKAAAMALKKVPQANSSWGEKSIIRYNNVDISVAVSIDDGLITPIVKNADQKSIFVISKEMKDLASRARKGQLKLDEFQGGSASISNLGMFGIKQFNAIVNPPQSCIFAIGAGQEIPAVVNKEIKIITVMNITLSCDHRIVDGVVGANVLQAFKEYIENPSRLLI